MATLAAIPDDGEAQLARAEMQSASDKTAALALVRAIDATQLGGVYREHRATLWAELSLSLGNEAEYHAAMNELRSTGSEPIVQLFAIEGDVRFRQLSVTDAVGRLAVFAKSLNAGERITTRLTVAQRLSSWGDNAAASEVLEGHVDLSQPSLVTKLYLEALAAARRDESFNRALALASDATRVDPDVCWIIAAHAWNTGDVVTSEAQVDALLRLEPRNLRGTLLKADVLARQDRVAELMNLLELPVESFPTTQLSDRFRLVQLLSHFGYMERSLGLAYQLLLQNRDQSRAWMTLANAVLVRRSEDDTKRFQTDVAGPNAAVNIRLEDGKERFIVIEPDTKLRALDPDSLEPDHELAQALTGLSACGVFELPDGRIGEVTQVRHKYIARFHDVLAKYEERFPTIFGFRSFSVDPSARNGLDAIIAQLKERHDFVTEETLSYVNGDIPLGVLAHRVGVDVIDAAAGVAESGNKVKVCAGNEEERLMAFGWIRRNRNTGCILDPLAFYCIGWANWILSSKLAARCISAGTRSIYFALGKPICFCLGATVSNR
jgi:cellulose synthase operon protein C